jgi:hypothetical protein
VGSESRNRGRLRGELGPQMNFGRSYPVYGAASATAAGGSRGGRAWAMALSVSLVLIVGIRFFSDSLGVLPGLAQYVDVPIAALLAFCSVLAFIRRGYRAGNSKYGIVLYLFVTVSIVSAWVNSSRVEPLAVAMFIFSFTAPLIVLIVTIHAELRREDVVLVLKTFFWLGVLELGIGILYDVPRFLASGDPDAISGTFGLNAYQFAYFLGLWMLYVLGGSVIGSYAHTRGRNVAVALAALAVFALFYTAQYRAMLIFFTLVILVALWVSPARVSSRMLLTAVISGISVLTLIVVATAFPNLKLLKVFDLFEDTTPIVESGKVQGVRNVLTMYGDIPQAAVIGSGPGTFSSRAYYVFASTPNVEKEAAGAFLMGLRGGQLYISDVANKYSRSIRFKAIQGGTTLANVKSSYTSLAAETGPLGLLVYLAAYVMALIYAFRRLRAGPETRDPLSAQLAFTCFGGLILMLVQGLFDNWLETTRVTIPLWILLGLLYSLERSKETVAENAAASDVTDGA